MATSYNVQHQIRTVLRGGDILLIVPPFAPASSPVLGVHILQALAERQGYRAEVLYLNVFLAAVIDMERFEKISFPPLELHWQMLAERLFARSAYGLPPLGRFPEYCTDEARSISGNHAHHATIAYEADKFDPEIFRAIEASCFAFVDDVVAALAAFTYTIIGCTQREGQTNCSIALLNGIKRAYPDTLTVTGGTNCKGALAQGIASLSAAIDYIFSGDSEESFESFLANHARGKLPPERIISGKPLMDLDTLPVPDYAEFLSQTQYALGLAALKNVALSYETSRGCWWGAIRPCHFCSENDPFRQKNPATVLRDVAQLSAHDAKYGIFMCDVGMPLSYHQEIFPQLLEAQQMPAMYYQSKANLALQDLMALKKTRIDQFTIGIEAFAPGLLKLMNKGITAGQNLLLLRNARSLRLRVDWLLLWGFPGDSADDYRQTLNILPHIRHFQPPTTFLHIYLARFSPYFERAEDFRISNLRPWEVYRMIYPEWADIENLAGWFCGEYPCAAHEQPQLIRSIADEVLLWKNVWETTYLVMIPFDADYVILDNRTQGEKKQHLVNAVQAREIMTPARYHETEYQRRALEAHLGVLVDSWYIPLVTASPEVLLHFEEVVPMC